MDAIDGYLPDAEEAQDVVYAVCVEEVLHVLEAACPPGASVLEHLGPVVGGEAPVLSVWREVVRRRACLAVEVEVARLGPYVAAVAVHADGYVALEHHALLAGVVVGRGHLGVEDVLHVVVEGGVLVCLAAGGGEGGALRLVPLVVVGPEGEVCRTVLLAQGGVACVWYEPRLCLFEEPLVCGGAHRLGTFLCVEFAQVCVLEVVDALVVYLRQGVELGGCLLKVLLLCRVGEGGQCAQVGVLRMQRKDADAAVRVGVGPGMRDGGVVDGEQLQHVLSRLRHEVYHGMQVAEVAHALASGSAQ